MPLVLVFLLNLLDRVGEVYLYTYVHDYQTAKQHNPIHILVYEVLDEGKSHKRDCSVEGVGYRCSKAGDETGVASVAQSLLYAQNTKRAKWN